MSVELHIFIQDSRVPIRDAWQHAIDELGFPAVLYESLDLRKATGFSPTTYKGQATGFELYLEPASDALSVYPHITPRIKDRDRCVTFRWGGDLTECAAALSAAADLTHLTDGIYFYPDEDIIYDAKEAVEATREDLRSI